MGRDYGNGLKIETGFAREAELELQKEIENSSIETNLLHLKEMIKHQKEVYNWTFTFIGADISTADAVSMNIDAATSVSISKSKILQGMEAASIKLCSYRNSRNVADLHYSNEERSQLS